MNFKNSYPCGLCGRVTTGLFCNITAESSEKVNQEKTVHTYEKGQLIFYEGNPPFAIYCIHDGQVKLYKTLSNGDRQIIRILGPGDIMGFRALIAEEPYSANAEAIEKTKICVIPGKTFHYLVKNSPDFTRKMMIKLAEELRESEDQMLSLLHKTVKQRTAALILSLTINQKIQSSL